MKRVLPIGWTLCALLLGGHQLYLWTGGLALDTELLALLPQTDRDEVAEAALKSLSERATQKVVALVSAPTKGSAIAAADAFLKALPPEEISPLSLPAVDPLALAAVLAPYREGLLAPDDVAFLEAASPEAQGARAQALLAQPLGLALVDFAQDPLQLFRGWLSARVSASRLRPSDGHLLAQTEGGVAVVLQLQARRPAFALDGKERLVAALEAARGALPPGAKVVYAGVPLFAEAAAARATAEMSIVGVGSLVAILVVMWLAFASVRPLALVVVSVVMGVAAGLSACALAFDRVHIITLVFGAALVGVAEDYGIHYFASRQVHGATDRRELLRGLLPGLLLAWLTSVAGYAVLALAPLPGLRQMALFSGVGLTAAFLTVVAWFPVLDVGAVRSTRFARAWASTRAKWPQARGRKAVILVGALLGFSGLGIARLNIDDDVRKLQSVPPSLLAAQGEVARAIGLPSPAQFFVVRGATEEEILVREEALREQLDALVKGGALGGYEAISSWVPSGQRQAKNRDLFRRARKAALEMLGEGRETSQEAPADRLGVDAMLRTPLGAVLAPLWQGRASVVLLTGLEPASLDRFSGLSSPGARFVDRTGELSSLLRDWRVGMSWLLLVGYAGVYAVLAWRFRRQAWRALLPTALASLVAVGLVGLLGEPFQLFHVLSLWLLLGMGVDYGVFLLEQPSAESGEAWLAIGLGATSTFLSFGLLALSTTPAVHAFGLVIGVGVAVVWALSPVVVISKAP